ncbi:MAG: alpha/beta fold hydrolase, partial [Candidatus Aminicenantes bacterium]|nr:alpha/beta fold hydrolase [Candidatus Aminicenantes bacterium]
YIFETSDDFVKWLDELFDELGLGVDINLVGLSYGGWITSQYALSRPERLEKIVLIAPVSTVKQLQFDWIWHASLCMIPHRYFFMSFMDWMLEDMARGDEYCRTIMAEEAESGFVALQCFKPRPMVDPTVLSDEDWGKLSIPALFLVGENEKLYPANAAIEQLNRAAPHIKTEVLPNCGHDLTILQAEMVNQILIYFLKIP